MKSLELKWGIIIGLANLIWLYGSYYLGMHETMGGIQIMVVSGFFITVAGFILGLRAVKKNEPEINYLEGLKSGVVMAGVTAVIAPLSQIGYFKWINPGWTKHMMELTREYYSEKGYGNDIVEIAVKDAEVKFALKNYLLQSTLGAIVIGCILSAMIMMFLWKRKY